jgi:Domain of unknown function (DUF4278)
MKLSYRGTSFDYDPNRNKLGNTGRPTRPAQTSQLPYMLTYRGTTYQVDPTLPEVKTPVSTSYNLIYRGTVYTVNRDDRGAVAINAHPAGFGGITHSVPETLPSQYVAKVHQGNLLRNLQHRLEVARKQNDQRLIQILEAEQRELSA